MSSASRICIPDFAGCVVAAADALREHFGDRAVGKHEIDIFLCSSFKPIADLHPWNRKKYYEAVFREVHHSGRAVWNIKLSGFVFRLAKKEQEEQEAPPAPVPASAPVKPDIIAMLYKDDRGHLHLCSKEFKEMKEYKWYYPNPKSWNEVKCLFDTELGDVADDAYVYQHETEGLIAVESELGVSFCKKFKFKPVGEGYAIFYPQHGCKFCGHDHIAIDEECEDSIAERKKAKPNQKKRHKA